VRGAKLVSPIAWLVLALAPSLGACGDAESAHPLPSPPSAEPASATDLAERGPRAAPAGCAEPALSIHKDARGFVDRVHAKLPAFDDDGLFLVDTGSQRSFAVSAADAWGPRSTEARLGCHTMTLPVLAREPVSTASGDLQRGVLGSDLLAHGSVLDLDLARGALAWYPAPIRARPPADRAVAIALEWRHGWLVASGVRVDGVPVKLVLDTGSPHVFLMSRDARPGEIAVDETDGTGAPVHYFETDGTVSLPGRPGVRAPVDRAESFPTLERILEDLGGDVAGLLGIDVLGDRRVVVSGTELVADLPPISAPSPGGGRPSWQLEPRSSP
jgi:hypothetical protein